MTAKASFVMNQVVKCD